MAAVGVEVGVGLGDDGIDAVGLGLGDDGVAPVGGDWGSCCWT